MKFVYFLERGHEKYHLLGRDNSCAVRKSKEALAALAARASNIFTT